MSTIITTLILVALACGLTYLAKTIVGNPATRRPKQTGTAKAQDADAENLPGHPVASHDDVLEFWTMIMNDTTVDVDTRLKASELLGAFHYGEPGRKDG